IGGQTINETFGVSASQLQTHIWGVSSVSAGNATVTSSVANTYNIELGSSLYSSHSDSVGGLATMSIDDNSLKLNSPWSVEPKSGASFEVTQFADVHVPVVKVRIFSKATPAVVVDEPGGSTSVAQGDHTVLTNNATIRVKLSADPGLGGATVTLGDNGANLISFDH